MAQLLTQHYVSRTNYNTTSNYATPHDNAKNRVPRHNTHPKATQRHSKQHNTTQHNTATNAPPQYNGRATPYHTTSHNATALHDTTMERNQHTHNTTPHVPAAPPDHQGTDGGAAGGRGRRGSPPEGVSGEAAQVGLQVGRQRRSPEAREGARDTTMARGRPAASTRSRRTTLRGRAGDRGEGRVERRERRWMYNNAG